MPVLPDELNECDLAPRLSVQDCSQSSVGSLAAKEELFEYLWLSTDLSAWGNEVLIIPPITMEETQKECIQ